MNAYMKMLSNLDIDTDILHIPSRVVIKFKGIYPCASVGTGIHRKCRYCIGKIIYNYNNNDRDNYLCPYDTKAYNGRVYEVLNKSYTLSEDDFKI